MVRLKSKFNIEKIYRSTQRRFSLFESWFNLYRFYLPLLFLLWRCKVWNSEHFCFGVSTTALNIHDRKILSNDTNWRHLFIFILQFNVWPQQIAPIKALAIQRLVLANAILTTMVLHAMVKNTPYQNTKKTSFDSFKRLILILCLQFNVPGRLRAQIMEIAILLVCVNATLASPDYLVHVSRFILGWHNNWRYSSYS